MKYVVDASYLASLLLPDEAQDASDALAERIVRQGATAPGLLQLEIANILLVAARRKRISGSQMKRSMEALERLPISLQPALTAVQCQELIQLAEKHGLTTYDAAYLDLAMRLNLPLATLDAELIAAAIAEGVKLALPVKSAPK